METTIETITPDQAASYLESNTHNRKAKDMAIKRYARDMASGRWRETGDAIKFSSDGTLLDGQNRLWACVEADAPFTTLVVRGVEADAQIVMDQGVGRSAADALHLSNLEGDSNTAATARIVLRIDGGFEHDQRGFNSSHTVQDVISFVEDHEDLLVESMVAGRMLGRQTGLLVRACAAFYLMAARAGAERDKLIHFVEGTASGVGLTHGDPRLALRSWASVGQGRTKDREAMSHLQAIVRTWNRFISQRPYDHVRLGEEIPAIRVR